MGTFLCLIDEYEIIMSICASADDDVDEDLLNPKNINLQTSYDICCHSTDRSCFIFSIMN